MSTIPTPNYAMDCPPSFRPVLGALETEHANLQSLWRYALVLLLIDEGNAQITDLDQDGETLHLVVRTKEGEHFSIIRPPMSEETEQLLLQHIREIEITESHGRG